MRILTDHIVSGDAANHQLTISVTDEPGAGGANHRYEISGMDRNRNSSKGNTIFITGMETMLFQNGPIKEFGVNGVTQEALLAIVIDRLRSFQAGPFASPHNEQALYHCVVALQHLQIRTKARIARGVEGTNQI